MSIGLIINTGGQKQRTQKYNTIKVKTCSLPRKVWRLVAFGFSAAETEQKHETSNTVYGPCCIFLANHR